MLRCAPAGAADELARIELLGFGCGGAEWLEARLGHADAVLVPDASLVPGGIDYTPFTGDHPSRAAAATALAVAILAGELPPDALGLDPAPDTLVVVAATRFGEVGALVVKRVP